MGADRQGESEQPALLDSLAPPPTPRLPAGAARSLPVAEVLLESAVPHLDRPFDYAVPAEAEDTLRPGCRVKVRFSGREMSGYVLSRREAPLTAARLSLISAVVSTVPVLAPEVLRLGEQVAARTAGVTADVIRAAIPPRAARVEKEFEQMRPPEAVAGEPGDHESSGDATASSPQSLSGAEELHDAWEDAPGGSELLARLAAGGFTPENPGPRAAALALTSFGTQSWVRKILGAVAAAAAAGTGAVIVVPDQRDADRIAELLEEQFGVEAVSRLSAEMGPAPRYRSFLRLRFGRTHIAVGTRSAVFAPVHRLGLIILLDDAEHTHAEPRAPYHHARDVALLRTVQTGAALVMLSTSRSLEVQRLVERAWLQDLAPEREQRRAASPRMVSAVDSHQQERDPAVRQARLPAVAYRAAREGLESGPVLVQVGRAGFVPAVLCERCRARQHCPDCHGPLSLPAHHVQSGALRCRWCGLHQRRHRCPDCGHTRFRAGTRGADRTAQELGRAFPNVLVISSTADQAVEEVGERPALVVSTPGVEPVAPSGYAAALLLDGDAQLSREGLDVPRQVLDRWFRAASLVRAHRKDPEESGTVVVTAHAQELSAALIRWDPVAFARRELFSRLELGLPPAMRMLSLTGEPQEAEAFVGGLELPGELSWIGPAPQEDGRHRYLLFFGYGQAEAIIAEIRRLRRTQSAQPSRREGSRGLRIAVDDVAALQI